MGWVVYTRVREKWQQGAVITGAGLTNLTNLINLTNLTNLPNKGKCYKNNN